MRKWAKYLLMTVFLLMALSPLTVSAKDTGGAAFTADGNNIKLYLDIEDGIAQGITSLRLQLFVEVEEGELSMKEGSFESIEGAEGKTEFPADAPFTFNSGIGSQVKSVSVKKDGNAYVIDLMLSGTTPVFAGIPAEEIPKIASAAAVSEDSAVPASEIADTAVMEYATASAVEPFRLHLTNTETIFLTNAGASAEAGTILTTGRLLGTLALNPTGEYRLEAGLVPESGMQTGETEKKPESESSAPSETENKPGQSESSSGETESGTPGTTEPGKDPSQSDPGTQQPDTGDSGDNTKPGDSDNPPAEGLPGETIPFDADAVPELTISQPLPGSGYIHFGWKEIQGADGYEILQVDSSGGKKVIATVMAGDGTEYEKAFKYNKTFNFEIRAFRLGADGKEKIYGKDSETSAVKTPKKSLGKVSKMTAAAVPGSKSVTISWKKMAKAEGYRIYQLNEETGKFETIRTINGTLATSYKVTKKYAKTYTFRMAAYKYDEDGKPAVFGNYSDIVSVTTPPGTVSGLKLQSEKKGKTTISWKKVTRAEGYQIYRSTAADGKYKKIKTIKKAGKVTYTDKSADSKATYYYKVRAFVTGFDENRVYGQYSSPKEIVVK